MKVRFIKLSKLIVFGFILVFVACKSGETNQDESWTFVSMPDFLNVDCDYPQIGWEDALSYVLSSVKNDNPNF